MFADGEVPEPSSKECEHPSADALDELAPSAPRLVSEGFPGALLDTRSLPLLEPTELLHSFASGEFSWLDRGRYGVVNNPELGAVVVPRTQVHQAHTADQDQNRQASPSTSPEFCSSSSPKSSTPTSPKTSKQLNLWFTVDLVNNVDNLVVDQTSVGCHAAMQYFARHVAFCCFEEVRR